MGGFVIRVGVAVTCVASLTSPDGTFDNAYGEPGDSFTL
jgi:hypothetical protein